MSNQEMKSVEVTAQVCIVSRIQGKRLIPVETFTHTAKMEELLYQHPIVREKQAESEMRYAFVQMFRERLKNDHKLKHQIGGIKWNIEVLSMQQR